MSAGATRTSLSRSRAARPVRSLLGSAARWAGLPGLHARAHGRVGMCAGAADLVRAADAVVAEDVVSRGEAGGAALHPRGGAARCAVLAEAVELEPAQHGGR